MGAISQRSIQTEYGNSTWAAHNPMVNGGSQYDYKNRVSFNSLSGGRAITSLSLTFYKESTNSGNNTWRFYATADANILPNNLGAATLLGDLAWNRSSAGLVTMSFPQSMMNVLQQFTGVWYLLIDADSQYQTTYTGGNGANAPIFEGTYSDGSIRTNVGGVWRMGTPYTNVGGVWRMGTAYTNVSGVWRQGT